MEEKKQKVNQFNSRVSDLPTVSVVIPTYNRASRLGDALRSVFNQTYQDFELIVVDDGSTDDTSKLMQLFPSVKYFLMNNNYGVSKARNEGLARAKGRYICFLDSDDLWDKKKLYTQVQWMEENVNCQVC